MTRGITAVSAVATGLLLAGCGGGSTTTTSPSPAATVTAVSSPLSKLALTVAEIETADPQQQVTEQPAPAATSLTGPQGATLDACGTTYPSESLRTQRLQLNFLNGPRVSVSNEVVRYSSAAGATQAYQELKAAVANCKPWQMSSTTVEPADPALVTEQVILAGQVPQQRADLPALYACFVYQFNADLLSAVYVTRDAEDQALHDCKTIGAAAASNLRQSG